MTTVDRDLLLKQAVTRTGPSGVGVLSFMAATTNTTPAATRTVWFGSEGEEELNGMESPWISPITMSQEPDIWHKLPSDHLVPPIQLDNKMECSAFEGDVDEDDNDSWAVSCLSIGPEFRDGSDQDVHTVAELELESANDGFPVDLQWDLDQEEGKAFSSDTPVTSTIDDAKGLEEMQKWDRLDLSCFFGSLWYDGMFVDIVKV